MVGVVIPVRLYAYGAIVLAIIGGFFYVRHLQNKAERYEDRATAAEAVLIAEREARAHEQKISKEATDDYESRLVDLAKDRADTPVRSVRLCRSPTGYVPAPSPAASGVSPPGDSGHESAPGLHPGYGSGLQTGEVDRFSDSGPELGPQLYALTDEKDQQLAQCASLIKWVGSR